MYDIINFKSISSPLYLKIGIVKSLEDPENKNRILISFPHENSECYASMLWSYLGENFGKFHYPEPGVVAVIGFVDNQIFGALIIGYLDKSEEKILPLTKENEKEIIKYKNGTSVEFDNKTDKFVVKVETLKKDQMVVDLENQEIQIKNESNSLNISYNFKESEINFKCKKIKLESEKITVNTESLEISSSNKLDINCGNGSIKANSNLDIKASMIKLN